MAVPNIFANVTTTIPLSQLDTNFATAITLGNTAVYLGNTTTALGNLTLNNVTIASGTASGNLSTGNVTVSGTLGVTGATTLSSTLAAGNTTITGTLSATSTLSTTGGAAKAEAAASQAKSVVGAFNAGTAAATTAELITFAQAGTQKISHFWANSTTAYQIQTLASGAKIQLMPDTGGTVIADVTSAGLAVTGTLSSSAATGAFTGLQVGTGSGANTGLIIGNYSSGVGGIWCTAVTPSTVNYVLAATTTVVSVNAPSGGTVNLNTNNVTTMSINSTGHTVGGASSPVSGVYGTNSFKTSTVSQTVLNLTQDATSSPFGMFLAYGAIDPNNTSSEFLYFTGGGTLRFSVRSNGGIVNFQANDSNLSDIRTKKNIELAGNYLDKICAIPVKTFLYKDQTDEFLNLGVIAQDVESVAPELIDSGGFGETPEDGVPLKSIYQTDLQFALMKAIQELAAKVAKLEAA